LWFPVRRYAPAPISGDIFSAVQSHSSHTTPEIGFGAPAMALAAARRRYRTIRSRQGAIQPNISLAAFWPAP